jgi:membrane associated rhomboid family serine protease
VILPIGLDETRVSRLPWVSIAILVLNVVAFAATSLRGNERAVEARFEEVVAYWRAHPYLELPPAMQRRFGVTRDELARATHTRVPAAAPAGAAEAQARLDALCGALLDALDDTPQYRWSLVPSRGAPQLGWLTHQFLHGGLGHLLGNMLVLALVVAPFLEDAWGRPFFLAFYLAGGVVAGAAQALPMGDSPIPIVGASGAISACLGAFAVRFAHRRVRMFYWVALFFRGTFFVPAWLYAFFGLALDLVGLKLVGTGGGVAYAAHVGGFLFGLGAAIAMRASGIEQRLTPEGAAPVGRSLAASRGADALAAGRVADARRHLEEALAKDREDAESLLALAGIYAAAADRQAATPLVERLLALRLSRGDVEGARAALRELEAGVDPALFRPAAAYRAAELADDPALADRFDEIAAAGGGVLAAKALLRSAERSLASDPRRARALAARARDAEGASQELRDRAEALLSSLPAADAADGEPGPQARWAAIELPSAARDAAPAIGPNVPVRLVACRLLGASDAGLDLSTGEGKRAVLPANRIAHVGAAVVAEHAVSGRPVRNAVLLDLLLHPRPGDRHRTVLRLAGHEMALGAIHPGVRPPDAYALVVETLLAASGAPAAPSAGAAAGRPFARYRDAASFEEAVWGRSLAA